MLSIQFLTILLLHEQLFLGFLIAPSFLTNKLFLNIRSSFARFCGISCLRTLRPALGAWLFGTFVGFAVVFHCYSLLPIPHDIRTRDFFLWRCGPTLAMASSFLSFLDHTQRRTTVGRTPLDEWSARRRDLYLTTHTTDKHQCPRWDSNPWSQQASGRRPMP